MTSADAPVQSTRLAILVPFAIVTAIWGSTWIVIRDQLNVVPPSWSVCYRFLVGGLAMVAYAAYRRDRLTLDARGWAFAFMLGVLQFDLNFNLVYRAEAHITSGLVAVVFAMLILPNAVLGRIFLGQALGRQLFAGSCVAIAGIALLFVNQARLDPNGPRETIIGIALTLLGVLSASIANVMQATNTAKRYPMPTMLGLGMLVGAALNAAVAWSISGPPVIELRATYLLGVLYLGVVASAVAFTLYFRILRVIGTAKAAYSGVIIPIIAMALSTVFEGFHWSPLAAGGAVLALTGLVIALTARRPTR